MLRYVFNFGPYPYQKQQRPAFTPGPQGSKFANGECHPSPEGPERHLDAARQELPGDNFYRSFAAQLPSPQGQFGNKQKSSLLWGRGNLVGILRDNLGKCNCESKIAARQWGVNLCREASRCLAGPSGSGNRKRWRQTGSRQSTPLSTIQTRYGSVSTPEATRTSKIQQNSLQKGSRYGTSVSTTYRQYGHDCGCRFLRTPCPRLLIVFETITRRKSWFSNHLGVTVAAFRGLSNEFA